MVDRPWVLGLTGNHQTTLPLFSAQVGGPTVSHSSQNYAKQSLRRVMGLKKRSDMAAYIGQIYMVYMYVHTHTTETAKTRTWEKSDARISQEA